MYCVLLVECLRVLVNCFVKQLAICLGVVIILLLNVIDMFSVSGDTLLDRPCMVLFMFLYVGSYLLI